ncbi:MAG: FAD-dependent oxidoreductase [Myxococcota bacterium]
MTESEDPRSDRRRFLKWAGALGSAGVLAGVPGVVRAEGSYSASGGKNAPLDVVIIGGGLAGLTAARDLKRAGNKSFVVLEARDRVGGRVLNHRLGDGYFSEAGGQWMGPGQTAVADLARELGVGTFKSDYAGKSVVAAGRGTVALDFGGGTGTDETIVAELEALARQVPSAAPWNAPRAVELDRMSLADFLGGREVGKIDAMTWVVASQMSVGAAPSKVSFLYYLSMLNYAGGHQALEGMKDGAQETRFHGGSEVLALKMAEALGDKVRLRTPVTRIRHWNGGPAEVHTPHGVFRARRVIVALSPPLCQRIEFDPPLPEARQELQKRWPAHAPLCKTAMVYQTPFWRDLGFNGQVGSVDGPVAWSYDNSPPDAGRGIINAFVRVAEIPAQNEQAKTLLANLYADAIGDERLRDPLEFHLHDWGDEPYTITCISPMPPGLLTSGLMPALRQNVGRLIWSGTETAEIWHGYMDGAVRSGHAAALEALQGLREGECA